MDYIPRLIDGAEFYEFLPGKYQNYYLYDGNGAVMFINKQQDQCFF